MYRQIRSDRECRAKLGCDKETNKRFCICISILEIYKVCVLTSLASLLINLDMRDISLISSIFQKYITNTMQCCADCYSYPDTQRTYAACSTTFVLRMATVPYARKSDWILRCCRLRTSLKATSRVHIKWISDEPLYK